MLGLPIFRKSNFTVDCDQCGTRFDPASGGVCAACKRILCFEHLHGGWLSRVKAELRGRAVCARCRAEGKADGRP